MIIAFEGIDGSGKTTQAKRLAERLDTEVFHPFDELGLGNEIRNFLNENQDEATQCLLMALLHARMGEVLMGREIAGEVTIMDRSVYTFYAYQSRYLSSSNGALVTALMEPCIVKPHLVILLDIDPLTASSRINDREEIDNFNDYGFQTVTRTRYLELAKDLNGVSEDNQWLVFEGDNDLDQLDNDISAEVDFLMP